MIPLFTFNNLTQNWTCEFSDPNIGYISGSGTEISTAFISPEHRSKGYCQILLSKSMDELDILYTGNSTLEHNLPVYTINLQGVYQMLISLKHVCRDRGRFVLKDGKSREEIIDEDNFRGKYILMVS
jgi:hypothetical protein